MFSFRVRLANGKTKTNSNLNEKFQALQDAGVKHGKYWNKMPGYTAINLGEPVGTTYVSNTPCNSGDLAGDYIGNGKQCFGYGHLVADYIGSDRKKIGGDTQTTNWDGYGDIAFTDAELNAIERLQPGDWIRYKTGFRHTVVIMSVKGDSITFTDCNYDGTSNIIRWKVTTKGNGHDLTKKTLLSEDNQSFYYVEKFSINSDYE